MCYCAHKVNCTIVVSYWINIILGAYMSGNTWGHLFRLTTFGESHGRALGGIVDGCPPNLSLDEAFIQERLNRRRPKGMDGGADSLATTNRKESDSVRLLSGVFENKTTGTPIAFIIENENQRSADYGELAKIFRPGHADVSYMSKYGIRDYRGGGRSSGRETVARVAGGAIAECVIKALGIEVFAATVEIGGIAIEQHLIDMQSALQRPFFAAADEKLTQWQDLIAKVRKEHDTLGGIVRLEVHNVPAGLGEPVFHKLDAMLAGALMSVGAVKGVEIGAGFGAARMRGSQNNDAIIGTVNDKPSFASNNAGGILGGISSGQNIILHAAIKPIPSIAKEQNSIDSNGNVVKLKIGGRHDICAIPRVIPVLKAMVELSLADALLMQGRMDVLS